MTTLTLRVTWKCLAGIFGADLLTPTDIMFSLPYVAPLFSASGSVNERATTLRRDGVEPDPHFRSCAFAHVSSR